MSETKILSREAFRAKLTAAIGDSRLNFSAADVDAHDAAQRAEIQRLQTACDNKDVLHEMNVSIIGQRDAEIERLKPFEDLVQKAIETVSTLQAGYAEKVQECARLERERDEARVERDTEAEFRAAHERALADLRARLEAAEGATDKE